MNVGAFLICPIVQYIKHCGLNAYIFSNTLFSFPWYWFQCDFHHKGDNVFCYQHHPLKKHFPKLRVRLNACAPCWCHHPADVSCKSNFYFRHPRSRANLTSWREKASVRKGHKVKQIMCLQYQAVIVASPLLFFCLFCFKFSLRPFWCQFPRSAALPVLVTDWDEAEITVAKGTSARLWLRCQH